MKHAKTIAAFVAGGIAVSAIQATWAQVASTPLGLIVSDSAFAFAGGKDDKGTAHPLRMDRNGFVLCSSAPVPERKE